MVISIIFLSLSVADTGSTGEPTVTNVENCQEHSEWDDFVESPADSTLCSSSINPPINVVPEATFSAAPAFHPTNSVSNGGSVVAAVETPPTAALPEPEPIANVPSEVVIESRPAAAVKLPNKARQLDSLPKISRASCDLPPPKNKTPDASSTKNKFDSFKDRALPKHRTSFSNSKNNESSSSNKERVNDFVPANSKTLEHGSSKSSDVFHAKEKGIQGYGKGKVLESSSNKSKGGLEVESTLLSVNGHADSESTVSSEVSCNYICHQ